MNTKAAVNLLSSMMEKIVEEKPCHVYVPVACSPILGEQSMNNLVLSVLRGLIYCSQYNNVKTNTHTWVSVILQMVSHVRFQSNQP